PRAMTRYDAVDGARTDGDEGVPGRTQLAMIGDGNDYVYVYDFGDRALEDNQNRIHLNGAISDEYVFIETPNATARHAVEGAIRVGSFEQLKVAPQKAYYYADGSIYTKLFGGASSKATDGPSVINYTLESRPQPIKTVPDLPYRPLTYSKPDLDAFVPAGAAPRPSDAASRATHDPDAHDPDASRTVDYSDRDARWSDAGIWSGGGVPGSDDIVVIESGQRVVLDVSTQVKAILVDGGELIVEDASDLALSADWVLVINGGLFQVGTEEDPFEHDFTLTLEGDDPGNDVDVMALRNATDANVVRATDAAPQSGAVAAAPPAATPDETPDDHGGAQDMDAVGAPSELRTDFNIELFELEGGRTRIDHDMRNGEVYVLDHDEVAALNIRALHGEEGIESVRFSVKRLGLEHIDSHGTFALFDAAQGQLNSGEIPAGRYTVAVEGFDQDGALGEMVARRTVTFEIRENALEDGGFEFGVADGRWSGQVDLGGWASNSTGLGEVWGDGHNGVDAADGSNFLELDRQADRVDRIWQNIETEEGVVYELSFKAAQRGASDEGIAVFWGGARIGVVRPESADWETVTFKVAGSGTADRLELRELSKENDGRGPLLDDVTLVRTSDTHALLGQADTWDEAVEMAEAAGGTLFRPDDQAEMDKVMEAFWKGDALFVNATDRVQEGEWTDSDGNARTYQNWAPNQPNNYRDQDFGFVINEDGQWGDQDADRPMVVDEAGNWRATPGWVVAEFDGLVV
ncbi:MAG: G8 domain-containing protein, partial [Pseudomonadota bacterium]